MSKIDEVMTELGHPDNLLGTSYLREAIKEYRPGMGITKELYPSIAAAAGTTPSRVERAMRHSIDRAWERGSYDAQQRWFGYTVDPSKGRPTVSEYVARMARIYREGLEGEN